MLDYVRMGYLLLIFGMVLEVLRSTNKTVQPNHNSIQETGATDHSKTKAQNIKRRQKVEQLNDVDYVHQTRHSYQGESQLYIFEDNEAVIKMIIKGRSPTMRHVSRTHRVALDRLFDRIFFLHGTQDPNQICWHQNPTRRHSSQRMLLTRWMESSSSFVQQFEFLGVFLWPFHWFSLWRSD